jgi:hypothetical protein
MVDKVDIVVEGSEGMDTAVAKLADLFVDDFYTTPF